MTRTILVAALFLTACKGDEDTDTSVPTDMGTDTDTPTPVGNDIVDIALGDPQFSILAGAIVDAGLEETLRSDGTFTVFAPTNDAFEDLGVDLSTLSTAELATILQYHVIAGAAVDSGSVPARADSAAGYTLFFDTTSGVAVNGATVTTPDVAADNGVVHVIDRVLLPPTLLDAAGYAGLTSLAGAVGAADPAVAALLGGPGDFTVFAPTNDAFDAIASTTAGLSQAELTAVLQYHVLGASLLSGDIPAKADTLLINAWGDPVTALFSTTGGVFVNGAEVVVADVKTTNGVVHVIDAVLLPPTIVDHAVNAGLTGLLDTVGAASGDLGTTLSGAGPFTVFAPTNAAFDAIAPVAATLTADELRDILLFHVLGGAAPVTSGDLANGEVPTLLTGQSVTVDVAGPTIEGAAVEIADIHGTNGTVHVIDAVLLPAN